MFKCMYCACIYTCMVHVSKKKARKNCGACIGKCIGACFVHVLTHVWCMYRKIKRGKNVVHVLVNVW